jgi:hypothetical protein
VKARSQRLRRIASKSAARMLPIPPLSAGDLRRFWKYVDKTPGLGPRGQCWEWRGARTGRGYGTLGIGYRTYAAHRLALLIQRGIDPGDKLACHTCDHPPCVRGDHLWPGTHEDNLTDARRKGRRPGQELNDETSAAAMSSSVQRA